MTPGHHDQVPDDAGIGWLARHIGEDIARMVVLRIAATLSVVAIVAGAMSESASPALKASCAVAGGAGVMVLLAAGLFGWRRRRQWTAIVLVGLVCVGLLAAVFIGSR